MPNSGYHAGNSDTAPEGTPRADNVEAYVYRDLDGSIQRGCVLRSGSSMSKLMLRFLGRDTKCHPERASVEEAISAGGPEATMGKNMGRDPGERET
jgi:hypothetical protein